MDVPIRERGVYSFGPFRLDPVRRYLLCETARVSLTARLFDTLLYLVENHERLVSRDELERAVWRGRHVEEGNLGRAISSLRKALQGAGGADGLIVTAPGRGYRFAAPVEFQPETYAALPEAASFADSPARHCFWRSWWRQVARWCFVRHRVPRKPRYRSTHPACPSW
jgi:DNA-binding winged helix-turn-helix (wHTH) protein